MFIYHQHNNHMYVSPTHNFRNYKFINIFFVTMIIKKYIEQNSIVLHYGSYVPNIYSGEKLDLTMGIVQRIAHMVENLYSKYQLSN